MCIKTLYWGKWLLQSKLKCGHHGHVGLNNQNVCCQALEARTVHHNGGKIKLYSREMDFLNYEAEIYHNIKVHLSLKD